MSSAGTDSEWRGARYRFESGPFHPESESGGKPARDLSTPVINTAALKEASVKSRPDLVLAETGLRRRPIAFVSGLILRCRIGPPRIFVPLAYRHQFQNRDFPRGMFRNNQSVAY